MATDTLRRTTLSPATTSPLLSGDEPVADRSDRVGFAIWGACFLTMAALIVAELIAGLFRS